MSDRFDVAVGAVFKYIEQMIELLSSMFKSNITWPNQEVKQSIISGFKRMGGINNCVGSIDGTHINIQ